MRSWTRRHMLGDNLCWLDLIEPFSILKVMSRGTIVTWSSSIIHQIIEVDAEQLSVRPHTQAWSPDGKNMFGDKTMAAHWADQWGRCTPQASIGSYELNNKLQSSPSAITIVVILVNLECKSKGYHDDVPEPLAKKMKGFQSSYNNKH